MHLVGCIIRIFVLNCALLIFRPKRIKKVQLNVCGHGINFGHLAVLTHKTFEQNWIILFKQYTSGNKKIET